MSEDKYDKKGKPNIPKSTYKDGDYQRLAETIMGKQNTTGSISKEDGNQIFSFLNQCNSFDDRMDIDNMTSSQAKLILKDIKQLEQHIKAVKPVLVAISSRDTKSKAEGQLLNRLFENSVPKEDDVDVNGWKDFYEGRRIEPPKQKSDEVHMIHDAFREFCFKKGFTNKVVGDISYRKGNSKQIIRLKGAKNGKIQIWNVDHCEEIPS